MAKAKKEKKTGKSKESASLKAVDLRAKTADELKDMVVSFKKEQFNSRFQKIAGEAPNVSRTRAIRKNLARIKTVMSEAKNKAKTNTKTKVKVSKNA